MRFGRRQYHSCRTIAKMFQLFAACLFVAVVATANADVRDILQGKQIRILRQESDIDPQGNYQWAYDTENGISAQERGVVRLLPKEETLSAQGSFQYTSPEGVPVAISYLADENGFQPVGSVIPTPPPVPQYILRALEYNRNHPEPVQPFKRY